MSSPAELWAAEYAAKGIPSSFRKEPSGAVQWFFEYTRNHPLAGHRVLDLGCGRGRNSLFAATQGLSVAALDFVCPIIDELKAVAKAQEVDITAQCQNITEPLPYPNEEFAAVFDLFVYKHQADAVTRRDYRREVARVLRSDGYWLISLADRDDGFYGPLLADSIDPEAGLVTDPVTGVASVLFTETEFREEISDRFIVVEHQHHRKAGLMHGQTLQRSTHYFILQRRSDA